MNNTDRAVNFKGSNDAIKNVLASDDSSSKAAIVVTRRAPYPASARIEVLAYDGITVWRDD